MNPFSYTRTDAIVFAQRSASLLLLWLIGLVGNPGNAAEGTNTFAIRSEWLVRSWQTKDGLPHNTVNAILQTRDGFLWLGTSAGLSRFDGVTFRNFGLQDGLKSIDVFRLAEDHNGTLWVGTVGGGVSRFQNGRFITYGSGEGFPESTVQAMVPDRDGSLWIGTENGLVKWNQGRFTPVAPAEGLPKTSIRALAHDTNGILWVATPDAGVFRGTNGHFAPAEKSGPPAVYSLLAHRDGSIWAGFGNGEMWRFREGAWQAFGRSNGLPSQSFESLVELSNGTVLCTAQKKGLYRFNQGTFSRMPESREITNTTAYTVAIDKDESIWVGTTSGGLFHLSPRLLRYRVAPPSVGVRSVAEGGDGTLWATVGPTIYQLTETRFTNAVLTNFVMYCSAATSDGVVWVAGEQRLCRLAPGEPPEVVTNIVNSEATLALCPDGEQLWLGTYYSALLKCEGNSVRVIAPRGSFGGGITSLARDADDRLWVGTYSGLFQLDHGTVRKWTTDDALLSSNIRALHRDPDGTLWIGTLGGGLGRLKNGRMFGITTRHGLIDDVISQILPDDFGHLWLGSNRGLMRLDRRELDALAEGKTSEIYPLVFDRNEGILHEQCSGGRSPNALKTKDGRLFFPTVNGLVEIDPKKMQNLTHAALKPALDVVLVDGQRQPTVGKVSIAPGKHRIEVHYTAPALRYGPWLRFRYLLEGLDQNWENAGTRRVASYEALRPGDYSFRVAVRDSTENWTEMSMPLSLVVQPFFWQTGWFRLASVFLVTMSGGAVVWWILGSRYRRERAILRESEARFRIVADSAPVMIWMAGPDKGCNFFNKGWLKFTGRPLAQELGRGWAEGIHPEDYERFQQTYTQAFDGRLQFTMEYRLRRHDGAYCWVLDSGLPRFGPNGAFLGYIGSATDINELKHAEAQLREGDKRMTLAAEAANLGLWVWDIAKDSMWASEKWKLIHAYAPDEKIGYDSLVTRIHPEDRMKVEHVLVEAFKIGGVFDVQHRLLLPNGVVRWVSTNGRLERTDDNRPLRILGISIDITERKEAEETARQLSGRLITAQEDERRRIARDLHDDFSQRLALLSVQMELLEAESPTQVNEGSHRLKELTEQVKEISSGVHQLSYQLHPAKLEQLGLAAAVRSLCRELSQQSGVRIDFVQENVPRDIPEDIALCLFRVIQESLQNVVRHSGAPEARVHLQLQGEDLNLVITDSGKGFDLEIARRTGGLGLISMQERVRLVHGSVVIRSNPGSGTAINIRVPV